MNYDDLQKEYIKAFKNKDSIRANVFSMLKSELKYKEIEFRSSNKEIAENDILDIIKLEVKKHNESIELYKKGGRIDLAEKEEQELKIIKELLPAEMTSDDIKIVVQKYIKELEPKGMSDFGKVMKEVARDLKGKAEGSIIKKIVEEEINNLSIE